MPTYDYRCDACGHEFEEWQSFTAEKLTKCPHCKKNKLQRLFGSGAAIVFKGSGFYDTDYRQADEKKKAESKKPAAEKGSEAASDTKTETKAEAKTETKSETKAEAKTEEPKAKKPTKKAGGSGE
jgi:putative FmdB family regulatory protein